MKKLILTLTCIAGLFFSSCETDSTGDVSRITIFPELTLLGESTMFSEVGQPFDDPGADASIGGASVEFETISGVDTTKPGFYNVTYVATNSDGFEAAASRVVIIYENNGTVAGIYDGIRANRGLGGLVLVSSVSGNDFAVSDLLGGWYQFGPNNYGPAYAFPGIITVNGGSVTSANGGVGGFGPVSISNGLVSGGVMTWDAVLDNYAPFGFPIQLTKITP